MELSESPAAPADDTSTYSGGPSPVSILRRSIPGLVEHLGWGPVSQSLVGPLVVVERQ